MFHTHQNHQYLDYFQSQHLVGSHQLCLWPLMSHRHGLQSELLFYLLSWKRKQSFITFSNFKRYFKITVFRTCEVQENRVCVHLGARMHTNMLFIVFSFLSKVYVRRHHKAEACLSIHPPERKLYLPP